MKKRSETLMALSFMPYIIVLFLGILYAIMGFRFKFLGSVSISYGWEAFVSFILWLILFSISFFPIGIIFVLCLWYQISFLSDMIKEKRGKNDNQKNSTEQL